MDDRKNPIARRAWSAILATLVRERSRRSRPLRRPIPPPRPPGRAGLHAARPPAPDVPPHGPHAARRRHRLPGDLRRAAAGPVRQPATRDPGLEGRHAPIHGLPHRFPAGHRPVLAGRRIAVQPDVCPARRLARADLRGMDARPTGAGRGRAGGRSSTRSRRPAVPCRPSGSSSAHRPIRAPSGPRPSAISTTCSAATSLHRRASRSRRPSRPRWASGSRSPEDIPLNSPECRIPDSLIRKRMK